MTDYIDRQAAIEALARTAREKFNLSDEYSYYLAGLMDGELAIKELPTIQPEPKEGRWIVVSDGYGNSEATACICECSECKDTIWVYKKSDRKWKYCPNCGAKMDLEGEPHEQN